MRYAIIRTIDDVKRDAVTVAKEFFECNAKRPIKLSLLMLRYVRHAKRWGTTVQEITRELERGGFIRISLEENQRGKRGATSRCAWPTKPYDEQGAFDWILSECPDAEDTYREALAEGKSDSEAENAARVVADRVKKIAEEWKRDQEREERMTASLTGYVPPSLAEEKSLSEILADLEAARKAREATSEAETNVEK